MSRSLDEFINTIKQSKSIAIISHQMPDADAFSSSMALREMIKKFYQTNAEGKKNYKKVDIFLDTQEIPNSLKIFIPSNGKIEKYFNPEKHPQKYDIAICLDCASADRMGKYLSVFENAKQTANIDHHLTNTRFADDNYVMRTSSACEALYFMFLQKRISEATKYMFSLLYAGIITDTNNLKNNADSISTERALSAIKQGLGSNLSHKVRANFFENNSAAKDELNSYAYSKKFRKYYVDDKLCVIVLNNKVFNHSKAQMEDAEGIVDEALYRKGVLVSAIVLEKNKNEIYVKLRGKTGIDVSTLAIEFNGGGHTRQAAFQFKGSIQALMKDFLPRAQALAKASQEENLDNGNELFQ